jgi:CNT family concentrative nucleoside transporter
VLWLPAGQQVLNGVSESVSSVSSVIGYGQEGIAFLFGDLAKFKLGFIFAFNVLPVIIFFSALIAILYHIGLMPKVIALLGGGLYRSGTWCAGSACISGNLCPPGALRTLGRLRNLLEEGRTTAQRTGNAQPT